ncbi:MAG: hypothetical protein C0506_12990 [Anaerolinea sp.]|nr:hypothetical protein [Anaerolinea sp.]
MKHSCLTGTGGTCNSNRRRPDFADASAARARSRIVPAMDHDPWRETDGVYDDSGMAWSLRSVGPHLHPGSEEATVALAARAAQYGLKSGGRILEIASALGAPARFVARRFSSTVICVDRDPRMHRALQAAAAVEELSLRCLSVRALTEHLPLRDGCMDGAWSQDAMCHMDKPAVVQECARVLRPGAVFAFSDWIARTELSTAELAMLADLWSFPSLLTISEYVLLLDSAGFDVLVAEDRTTASSSGAAVAPPDQAAWEASFTARFGDEAVERNRLRTDAWRGLVVAGRGGFGMFIARRRG